MATIDITINDPLLDLGQEFTVYYRKVGDTVWILHGNETNDPFSIDIGTDFGSYEIRVAFLECPDFIYGVVDVFASCTCPATTTAQLIRKTGSLTVIRFDFTSLPAAPPCGWEIEYRYSGGPTITIYPASITDPFEVAVLPNKDYVWFVKVNCCSGLVTICQSGQLASASTVDECDAVVLKPELTPPATSHVPLFDGVNYYFEVLFQQSDPVTPIVTVKYGQVLGGDNGTIPITPVASGDPTYPWKVRFIVNPVPGGGNYAIGMADVCLEGWTPWY